MIRNIFQPNEKKKRRKFEHHYDRSRLDEAVARVRSRELSVNQVSQIYSIPRSTVSSRLRKDGWFAKENIPANPFLPDHVKLEVGNWIRKMSEINCHCIALSLPFVVREVCEMFGEHTMFPLNNMATEEYCLDIVNEGSEMCYDELGLLLKAPGSTEHADVTSWLNKLYDLLEEHYGLDAEVFLSDCGSNASQVFCFMELCTVTKPEDSGSLRLEFRNDADEQQLLTMYGCASATGRVLKPILTIKKRTTERKFIMRGREEVEFPRTIWSREGILDCDTLHDWLYLFVDDIGKTINRPILVFLDQSIQHISLAALDFCHSNLIVLYYLPCIGGIDILPFGSVVFTRLKENIASSVQSFPRRIVAKNSCAQLLSAGLTSILSEVFVKDLFKQLGLLPLNSKLLENAMKTHGVTCQSAAMTQLCLQMSDNKSLLLTSKGNGIESRSKRENAASVASSKSATSTKQKRFRESRARRTYGKASGKRSCHDEKAVMVSHVSYEDNKLQLPLPDCESTTFSCRERHIDKKYTSSDNPAAYMATTVSDLTNFNNLKCSGDSALSYALHKSVKSSDQKMYADGKCRRSSFGNHSLALCKASNSILGDFPTSTVTCQKGSEQLINGSNHLLFPLKANETKVISHSVSAISTETCSDCSLRHELGRKQGLKQGLALALIRMEESMPKDTLHIYDKRLTHMKKRVFKSLAVRNSDTGQEKSDTFMPLRTLDSVISDNSDSNHKLSTEGYTILATNNNFAADVSFAIWFEIRCLLEMNETDFVALTRETDTLDDLFLNSGIAKCSHLQPYTSNIHASVSNEQKHIVFESSSVTNQRSDCIIMELRQKLVDKLFTSSSFMNESPFKTGSLTNVGATVQPPVKVEPPHLLSCNKTQIIRNNNTACIQPLQPFKTVFAAHAKKYGFPRCTDEPTGSDRLPPSDVLLINHMQTSNAPSLFDSYRSSSTGEAYCRQGFHGFGHDTAPCVSDYPASPSSNLIQNSGLPPCNFSSSDNRTPLADEIRSFDDMKRSCEYTNPLSGFGMDNSTVFTYSLAVPRPSVLSISQNQLTNFVHTPASNLPSFNMTKHNEATSQNLTFNRHLLSQCSEKSTVLSTTLSESFSMQRNCWPSPYQNHNLRDSSLWVDSFNSSDSTGNALLSDSTSKSVFASPAHEATTFERDSVRSCSLPTNYLFRNSDISPINAVDLEQNGDSVDTYCMTETHSMPVQRSNVADITEIESIFIPDNFSAVSCLAGNDSQIQDNFDASQDCLSSEIPPRFAQAVLEDITQHSL